MNCGCCRVEATGQSGNCEPCYDGLILTMVSRAVRDMAQRYMRRQLYYDQGCWWRGGRWWWGHSSEEEGGNRVSVPRGDDEDKLCGAEALEDFVATD